MGARFVVSICGNRFCLNIGREHKSNGIYFIVDLTNCTFKQHCHDPECRTFRSRPVQLPVNLCHNSFNESVQPGTPSPSLCPKHCDNLHSSTTPQTASSMKRPKSEQERFKPEKRRRNYAPSSFIPAQDENLPIPLRPQSGSFKTRSNSRLERLRPEKRRLTSLPIKEHSVKRHCFSVGSRDMMDRKTYLTNDRVKATTMFRRSDDVVLQRHISSKLDSTQLMLRSENMAIVSDCASDVQGNRQSHTREYPKTRSVMMGKRIIPTIQAKQVNIAIILLQASSRQAITICQVLLPQSPSLPNCTPQIPIVLH